MHPAKPERQRPTKKFHRLEEKHGRMKELGLRTLDLASRLFSYRKPRLAPSSNSKRYRARTRTTPHWAPITNSEKYQHSTSASIGPKNQSAAIAKP